MTGIVAPFQCSTGHYEHVVFIIASAVVSVNFLNDSIAWPMLFHKFVFMPREEDEGNIKQGKQEKERRVGIREPVYLINDEERDEYDGGRVSP